MQSNICETFLNGFCPKRHLCENSHKIKTCTLGPNCPIQSQCEDRHPPLCKNFVQNKCVFFSIISSLCAFFHPTNVNQMLRRDNHTNLLFPPPSHPPMHPPPLHPPPLHNLQQRLTKLETKFMESTTKLNSKILSL